MSRDIAAIIEAKRAALALGNTGNTNLNPVNNFNTNEANAMSTETTIETNAVVIKATPLTDSQAVKAELAKKGEVMNGDFKAYHNQLPIAEIEGTRIVKCLYMAAKTGENKGKRMNENSFVRIPTKHLSEAIIINKITELAPFVLSYFQDIEDSIIKESHKKGSLQVFLGGLNLEQITDFLEAKGAGGRLNKERIEQWFDDEVSESLTMLFAEKMGLDENSDDSKYIRLQVIVNSYKGKFAGLSSPKCYYPEADCEAMIKVITSCELEDSLLGARFITRLKAMNNKEDDLLFSL